MMAHLDSTNPNPTLTSDKIIPVRHYGRIIGSAIAVLLCAQFLYSFVMSPYLDWDTVRQYLFNGAVLNGLMVSLQLTVIAMVASLLVAILIAIMRTSPSKIISAIAGIYVFIFRGVPLLVILIVIGNLGLFYKRVHIGIPFTDITFYSAPIQQLLTPFVASVIGLTLSASAYMSEIVRSGLLAINRGQHAASKALGMNSWMTLRYIVLPQALRVITPPLGNEFVNVLKATSLVSVIAGGDLLTITQSIAGSNYRTIEMMIVATIWYLVVISIVSVFQNVLERKMAEK
ncbi:amino acid ABC transporter permease [Rhizobium pusense]|uniref:Amino acid ABC transporter permease n=3 Tax=Agrobacterium TaxID=357 RepID=A0A6H0ZH41_9HYPH|nr:MULTISPECIES: amino acid ABC transporter permease [Rhizobium/Agrobacterium group]QCM13592.1 amino acid ABC transporter permease [Agrobacterium tumefaciens]MDH0872698.1 amino acid ABC transporter permease [Agrobacterium pusense]MDH0912492.1 amino acid ABC transporter permease [Agrobacterium pusense]MDH1099057.1 amino acid ABC transporter permease [Agrobacterium pusense]MDH1115138.1 amino acid ABC transporter permease [Agrobacterium pusense]